MANIYSYPQIGELADADNLIISDASNGNKTKSVTIEQLSEYLGTSDLEVDNYVNGGSYSSGTLTLTRTGSLSDINISGFSTGVVQTLTTTGTSGAATLTNGVLNIPQYSGVDNYVDGGSISGDTLTLTRTGGLGDVDITGLLELGSSASQALAGDTTTITQTQADDITANNAKVSFPEAPTDGQQYARQNSSWSVVSVGGGGTVTSIATNTPITGGTITGAGTIGITQASTSTDGYLSSTDWNTFNNKSSFDGAYSSLTGAPSLAAVATSGNYNDLTNRPTIPAAYTDSDVDAHLNKSAQTQDGYVLSLSSNDYTWVAQSDSGGTVTSINTTAPITGGTITTTGAIGITQASGTADGYLSSTDWNTFNNKSTFDGQYSSLTGAPTLATVATSGNYNDLTNKPTIPPAYGDSDVDSHLNKSTAQANEVLSWTGSAYDWVAQSGAVDSVNGQTGAVTLTTNDLTNDSGYIEGTTTGTGSISAITEIKTLTLTEYGNITPAADVMYVIV